MKRKMHPKNFFTPEEEKRIVSAIQDAEKETSGEIRVHLAKRSRRPPYDEAVRKFEKLGMAKTAERNGVLIYLALEDKHFAVVGDHGIHEKVPEGFWDKIRDAMTEEFKQGEFAKGLVDAIGVCGVELARYFPRRSDDKNELSDAISEN